MNIFGMNKRFAILNSVPIFAISRSQKKKKTEIVKNINSRLADSRSISWNIGTAISPSRHFKQATFKLILGQ